MRRTMRTCFVVLGLGLLGPAVVADDAAELYHVEVERIVSEDSMLVTRYVITAPRRVQYVLTRNGSRDSGHIWPARASKEGEVKAKITVVATVSHTGGDTETHLFKIETATGSSGGTGSGTVHANQTLKDLISLTAKSGDYKIGAPLNLGTFEGGAITLLVK